MSEINVESPQGLLSLFQEAKQARLPYEGDWKLNRAFFVGHQWVTYQGGKVSRPAGLDPKRQYVTDNRLKPMVIARVARKTRNRPMFAATPQGGDDSAIAAARLAERILENDWESLRLHPKLHTALMWADLCADGFVKTFWDPHAGRKAQALVGPDGAPLVGPSGGLARPEDAEALEAMNPGLSEMAQVVEIGEGDVRCEVKSPFEIYPAPLATSMEDLEYLFDETVRSFDYVRERYPQDINGNEFMPHSDAGIPSGISEGFYPGSSAGLFHSPGSKETGGVLVREYHARPSQRYPDGLRVTIVNEKIVEMIDTPDDPVPYDKFGSIEVPGRFWSSPIATDLRQLQVDFNMLRTQVKENARLTGNPALLASRQADVSFYGVPGERIDYDSTVVDAKPEYLNPPPLPTYVENELARIEKAMEEVAGMHEVSRAQVPNGITAASAINLLLEGDETRLGPEIQQMEFALGQWGTRILRSRAKNDTDERLITVAGEDGRWNPVQFKGEMLGDDPQIEVQAGSQMPRSKAAKQAAMTEILTLTVQNGVALDERNLRRFLKDYEIGGLDRLFEGMTEDAKQVNREIRQLLNGEQVPINSFDNHEFHIADMTEFMKTHDYAQQEDQIKMLFEWHVAEHRRAIMEAAELQAQAQSEAMAAEQEDQAAMAQETEIIKNITSPAAMNEGGSANGTAT